MSEEATKTDECEFCGYETQLTLYSTFSHSYAGQLIYADHYYCDICANTFLSTITPLDDGYKLAKSVGYLFNDLFSQLQELRQMLEKLSQEKQ